jgi:predicted NACHT family NTPase
MIIPVTVLGVGLILLFVPVRRSRRGVALRRSISQFDRDYRALVLASLRFIDQKGLATVGPFTPELDDVYVDVSLAPRPPHLVNEGLLPDLPADVTERRALSEFLGQTDPVVLAVIGAPGSGKTTLLRHTARQVCQRRLGQKRHLPILLYLRDHVTAVVADPNVTLTALLRGMLGELRPAEPDGWLEQRLRDGECVVLLDGLDEVARPEDRRKVASWAERQIRQYPGNDYVITSRPQGYRAAKIDGADVLQVRGFTTEQASRFVRSWYLAVERHSTGAVDEDITIRARREADDLLQRLDRAPSLYDLTVNPLLLTMIANVHRYRGALPGSRADLYAEILQVMLVRRQEAKDLPVELVGDKKEALLRGLAYAMMDRRLSDLPHDDVLAEIRPVLRRLPRQVTAEGFLADVRSNGLFVERETRLYCFAHHTFQEYLAAAYVRDKGLANVLASAVDDPWWRETTLLYAARADADPIVAACLNSGTITALALAFDCADQGSAFAEDLRERLENLLTEVSDPATSQERRRLITGVLLTRHLQQQIRTSTGTRICTRPITASLYQLFRDDTHTPAPDSPPSAARPQSPPQR